VRTSSTTFEQTPRERNCVVVPYDPGRESYCGLRAETSEELIQGTFGVRLRSGHARPVFVEVAPVKQCPGELVRVLAGGMGNEDFSHRRNSSKSNRTTAIQE
jgi:hypothetical protein